LANDNQGHIGEIRYSILTLEQFQERYGEEWELMKGQSLSTDSELFRLWGKDRIPDARGLFLRGHNNGRTDCYANPDRTELGLIQKDCFKNHDHGGGKHRHEFSCEFGASREHRGGQCNTMAWHPPTHENKHTTWSDKIIKDEGGNETRPKNLTVNIFIKMRESSRETPSPETRSTSPSQTQTINSVPTVTPEMMNEITTRPEFRAAVENAVREMTNRNHR
jgi:hypothetical protein